jgi:hypothetical protein
MSPSTRYSRIHASRPWVASRKRKKPRRKVMRSNPGAEKEPVMTKVREVLVYRGFLEEGQFRPYTEVVADQSVELRNIWYLKAPSTKRFDGGFGGTCLVIVFPEAQGVVASFFIQQIRPLQGGFQSPFAVAEPSKKQLRQPRAIRLSAILLFATEFPDRSLEAVPSFNLAAFTTVCLRHAPILLESSDLPSGEPGALGARNRA